MPRLENLKVSAKRNALYERHALRQPLGGAPGDAPCSATVRTDANPPKSQEFALQHPSQNPLDLHLKTVLGSEH
jgi:hypothetical protein